MKPKLEHVIVSIDLNQTKIQDAKEIMRMAMSHRRKMSNFGIFGYASARCILMNIVIAKNKYKEVIEPILNMMAAKDLNGVTAVMLNSYRKELSDGYVSSLARADYILAYEMDAEEIITMLLTKADHCTHQYLIIPDSEIKSECEWLMLRMGLPVEICDIEEHRKTCEPCRKNITMKTDEQTRSPYHA
ncbi:MAG: hypothetical protein MUP55_00035 [Candidatus Aenigmarchaeota archaeon]|nr:hypothetical protein [Candidatus Aenigmarchaeota archaeon]